LPRRSTHYKTRGNKALLFNKKKKTSRGRWGDKQALRFGSRTGTFLRTRTVGWGLTLFGGRRAKSKQERAKAIEAYKKLPSAWRLMRKQDGQGASVKQRLISKLGEGSMAISGDVPTAGAAVIVLIRLTKRHSKIFPDHPVGAISFSNVRLWRERRFAVMRTAPEGRDDRPAQRRGLLLGKIARGRPPKGPEAEWRANPTPTSQTPILRRAGSARPLFGVPTAAPKAAKGGVDGGWRRAERAFGAGRLTQLRRAISFKNDGRVFFTLPRCGHHAAGVRGRNGMAKKRVVVPIPLGVCDRAQSAKPTKPRLQGAGQAVHRRRFQPAGSDFHSEGGTGTACTEGG